RRPRLGRGRPHGGGRGPVRNRAAARAAGPRRTGRRAAAGRRGSNGMTRILVVEDNADLAYGLRNNLEIEGYDVDVVEDGTQGLARARSGGPDLIILDLMLPGMDGYRVLRALRDEGRRMPILILTARGEEADKVRGLRLGADPTRMERLTEVWGYSAAVLSRTVDTHVAELRRKLEGDPAAPKHILTVRKAGYRLER